MFYERKKRRLRCSHFRRVLLLLNRARCAPSSGVLFKRNDITSTLSEGKCRLVCLCPIQTIIQRARKRDTKTRARVLKTSFLTRRRRRTQRERERENKTHAAVILPTILFVSQRGNSFVIFYDVCLIFFLRYHHNARLRRERREEETSFASSCCLE